jgi:dihydroneopterin aldolase
MKIHIEDLQFQCIIGILDFEREKEQDVIVTVEIEYTFEQEFINYAEVAQLIENTLKKEKFLLIEDALHYLFKNLQEKFPHIKTLYIKITKPSILANCSVSVSDFSDFDS